MVPKFDVKKTHVPFGITSVIYQELLQGAKFDYAYSYKYTHVTRFEGLFGASAETTQSSYEI